jgi:hypothetical protein
MATYATDLVLLATGSDGEGGTWVELASPYDSGGTPASDAENFIQGSASFSQSLGNKIAVGFSVAFDATADISSSFLTGYVVHAWVFFVAGSNLYDYATTGGQRFGIAADTAGSPNTSMDMWFISGDDRAPNPYGGWWNVAIDPTHTPDALGAGGGNGGVYWYFGSLLEGIRAKISKGTPHAVDAIRMGRGEIFCTGADCTFAGFATANDANTARWGCFQDVGGSFLWKGLLSFGQTTGDPVPASATFSDSNIGIVIDDTPKTNPDYNKIAIKNASTSVTWINVSITARGTYAPGNFEMVDNATLVMEGCSFNNMGTFLFLSNGDAEVCIFNGCNTVTSGDGSSFFGTSILSSTVALNTGALIYNSTTDPDTLLEGMTFSKGINAHHAIDFGTSVTTDITLRNCDFDGFGAVDDSNDSTVRFLYAGPGNITLNLVGCQVDGVSATTDNFSVDDTAGVVVTLSIDPVTALVHVVDNNALPLQDARVYMRAFDNSGDLPYLDSVDGGITRVGTLATAIQTAHGLVTGNKVVFQGITNKVGDNYGGREVNVLDVNTYTYLTTDEGATTYTGLITSTGVFIDGLTDIDGNISNSRTFGENQPIFGYVRKSTDPPRFKSFTLGGTIDSQIGLSINVRMVLDE